MRFAPADALVTAVAASGAVGVLEASLVGGGVGLALTIIALHLALGILLGGLLLASEYAAARAGLRGPARAAILSIPALLAMVPVGATLFDGGFASTLPAASSGFIWFPLLSWALVAVSVAVGARMLEGRLWLSPAAARWTLVGALVASTVIVELANRGLFRSEYPRVHTVLIVYSCAALTVAARFALGQRRPASARLRVGLCVLVVACAAAATTTGMTREDERWAVATRGNHARHLAVTVRAVIDLDRDGYARVLGGGDCDDLDGAVNPGAVDTPGNGHDEDCDGIDSEVVAAQNQSWDPSERAAAQAGELRQRMRDANLLVISIDALRADIVSAPGADKEFPNLSRLLGESRWFRRGLAPSSGTDVSLSSLLTGRVDPFVPVEATLLETLAASGRAVHAVLPREVLRWAPKTLLTRGAELDEVINDGRKENIGDRTTSVETTERGLAFLKGMGGQPRFCLWLHYFDVHEHLQVKASDRDLAALGRDLTTTEGKYRALLSLTDRELGRVIAELESRGLYDSTVVVLFSDHGESLGEDSRLPNNHGKFVYRALTEIPIALRVPGVSGAAIDEPVTLIDLYPTLVALLSLEAPSGLDGQSLLSHLVPRPAPPPHFPGRVLVTNDSHQWGVVEWPLKLMYRPDDNLYELYDLVADPDESRNLAADDPRAVSRLKQLYQRFPKVSFDRSRSGRRWREAQARPPRPR